MSFDHPSQLEPAKAGAHRASCAWDIASVEVHDEDNDTVTVSLTLKDARAGLVITPVIVDAYLADEDEIGITSQAATSIAAGTNGSLLGPLVTGKMARFISEEDGKLDIVVGYGSAKVWNLVLIKPDGGILITPPLEFAA